MRGFPGRVWRTADGIFYQSATMAMHTSKSPATCRPKALAREVRMHTLRLKGRPLISVAAEEKMPVHTTVTTKAPGPT